MADEKQQWVLVDCSSDETDSRLAITHADTIGEAEQKFVTAGWLQHGELLAADGQIQIWPSDIAVVE